MIDTIQDAKASLEKQNLYVAYNNKQSLWIAGGVRDAGEGVRVSNDACSLIFNVDRWIAIFPALGMLTYEVPGNLEELVYLIEAVYSQHLRAGNSFTEAVKQIVEDSEQYLVGRSLSRI
jgi:hypothetical protein